MKTAPLAALLAAVILYSCKKDPVLPAPVDPITQQRNPGTTTTDTTKTSGSDTTSLPAFPASAPSCGLLPIYGDTLLYPQPASSGDDVLAPVNSPGTGKYFAWPAGMVIDQNTGAIDLTQSQTGMKYAIGFVRTGTTDTCLNFVTLGGASYVDSIYVVNSGGVKAVPYFNGNPFTASECVGSGPGSGCAFDVTGSAAALNVVVSNSSGEIALQNTLNGGSGGNGVFGPNPFNGQTVTVPIYYQLRQGSNNAMQQIDVELMYFDSKADMNMALLSTLSGRSANLYDGGLISTSAMPRPPLIILVRRN
ncbi:MAG TPA: hypothetical protein VNU70_12315 [Puia sp.]|nr:hypothetical protein [Puia sp.]